MKKTSGPVYTYGRLYALSLFLLILLVACGKKGGSDDGTTPPPVDPPVPPPVTVTAKFEVKESKIVDQDGVEFIAKGINVNGPYWPWTRATLPDVNLIADTWKCNIVRVNDWDQNRPYPNDNNSNLDAIVNAFSAKKVVVLIEDHSFTGRYPNGPELAASTTFWTNMANKYKSNPYVWFNLMNEPGGSGPVPVTWLQVHEALIQAIRNAGADNVIVCDEHQYGQVNGFDAPASSAALTYGEGLVAKYKNLVFSLHMYDLWIYGKGRLESYISAVQAKKLALLIGEYGVGSDYSMDVASSVFKVCIPGKIGRIGWHWDGEDIHKLTTTGDGGGYNINNTSGAKPTNLSFTGNLIWKDNHGELTAGDPDLEPPPVIVGNPNFEAGTPANDATQISGWINFGTAHLDNTAANVKEGSYSVRINAGAAGGCGQGIYLQPGATYKITAWGKNSAISGSPSSLGLKYKTITGGPETNLASLDWTGDSFQEQTATFAVPATIAEMFLFIYKNDAAPAFWCDDVRIEKQ